MARLVCALFLVCLVPLAAGYAGGASTKCCVSLTPLHGDIETQTGPSPFGITAPPTAAPAEEITITIYGSGDSFKGFLVRAFDGATNNSTGHFTDAPNYLKCDNPNDSASHSGADDNFQVDLYWKAPAHATSVTFKSLVVVNYATFHSNDPVTIQIQDPMRQNPVNIQIQDPMRQNPFRRA